jgi:hypothetical protein
MSNRYTPPPVDTAQSPDELREEYGYAWKLVYANDFFSRQGVVVTGWMNAGPNAVPAPRREPHLTRATKAVYPRPRFHSPFEYDEEWVHQGWGEEVKSRRLDPEYHVAYRYDEDAGRVVPCDLVPPSLSAAELEEHCKPLDLDIFKPGKIYPAWKHYTTSTDRTCTWQGCYHGDGFTDATPPSLHKLSQHGDTALNVLNGLATSHEHQPATASYMAFRQAKTVLWVLCRRLKKNPSDPAQERTNARLGIWDMDGLESSGYQERKSATGYDCSDWTQVPLFSACDRLTASIAIMHAERLSTEWMPVPLNWYTPVQLRVLFGAANMLALQVLGGHEGRTYPHADMTGVDCSIQKICHHNNNVGRLPAVATLMALRLNQASIALHRGCPTGQWPNAHNDVQPAAAQITRNGAASYLTVHVPPGDDTHETYKRALDFYAGAQSCRNILSAGRRRHPTDTVEGCDGTVIADVYEAVAAGAAGAGAFLRRVALHTTYGWDNASLIDFGDIDQVKRFFAADKTPIKFESIDAPLPTTTTDSVERVTCTLQGFHTLDTTVQCYHPLAPRRTGPDPDGYDGGLFCFVPSMVPPLPGNTDVKARQPDFDPTKDDENDTGTRRRDRASVHRQRRSLFSYAPVAKTHKDIAGQSFDAVREQSSAAQAKWYWRAHQHAPRCEGFHKFRDGPINTGSAQSLTRVANTGIAGAFVLLPNFPSLPYNHDLNLCAEGGPKLGPGSRPQNAAIKLAAWSLPGFAHFCEPVAIFAVADSDAAAVENDHPCLRRLPRDECSDACLFKMRQHNGPHTRTLFEAPLSAHLIAGTQFDAQGQRDDLGAEYVIDTLSRFGSLKGVRPGMPPPRYAHLSDGRDAGLCFRVPPNEFWESVPVIGREAELVPMPERELFGACITLYLEQLWGSTLANFMTSEPNRPGYFYVIFRDVLKSFFPTSAGPATQLQEVPFPEVPFPQFVLAISMAITENIYLKNLKLNIFGIPCLDSHILDQPTCQGQLALAARIAEIGFVTTGFLCNAMTPLHRRFWPGFTRPMQGQRYWVRRAQEMILGFFTNQGLHDQLALLSVTTSQPFAATDEGRYVPWTKANALFCSRSDMATLIRESRTVFRATLPDPNSLGPLVAYHPCEFFNCGDYHSVISAFEDARNAKLLACDAFSKPRNATVPEECFTTMQSAGTLDTLKRQMDAARSNFADCLLQMDTTNNAALCQFLRGPIDAEFDADLSRCVLPERLSRPYYKMFQYQEYYVKIARFNTRRGNRMALDIMENRSFINACARIMIRITDADDDSEDENQPMAASQETRQQRQAAALEQEYRLNIPLQSQETIAQAAQQIADQEQRRDQQPAAAAAPPDIAQFTLQAQNALDKIETTTQLLSDSIYQSPDMSKPSVPDTLATVRHLDLDLDELSAANAEKIITYYTYQERRKRNMEEAFQKHTKTIQETKEVIKRAKTTVAGPRPFAPFFKALYNGLQCPVGLELPIDGPIMRSLIETDQTTDIGVGMATSTDMAQRMKRMHIPDNLVCAATHCRMLRPQPFTQDRILTDIRDAFVPYVRAAMQATEPQLMAQVEDPDDDLTWPVAMDSYLSNL